MFGKSARWWLGPNSLFGQGISQTKWGKEGAGSSFNVDLPGEMDHGIDKDTQTLIIVAVLALVLFK